MTKKRYWTQFGYSSQDALRGWDFNNDTKSRTSPWSSQTKYYMENIVKNSSLFFREGFWYGDSLQCALKEHPAYIISNILRRNYLGYYFDYELQGK